MNKNLLPIQEVFKKIKSLGLDSYINDLNYGTRFKKYKVTLKNGKTVQFGDIRYEDYLIHKNNKRRENYRLRHKGDNINDINFPGFWSYHVLW